MEQSTTGSSTASTRRKVLGVLVGIALVAAVWTPLAQASLHGPYQDLGRTVDAGEYVAYQVEMPSSGWIYVGGEYLDAQSDSAVLPIVNVIDGVDNGYSATTGFYYDSFRDEPAAADVTIQNGTHGQENVHTHAKEISSSPFPAIYFGLGSGTYNIVALTGEADGEADLWTEVPEDAEVTEAEQGDGVWARGLDESELGYEIRTQAGNGLAADYHEWYYSGADVEIDVEGGLYGYMGFSQYTESSWLAPGGEEASRWVADGETGTWTMSFPEEHYEWRNCIVPTVCVGDDDANLRLYPPFGVAADVGFA